MIQSFLVEEAKELIYDTDKLDEWKEKCEQLGLENQLSLCSKGSPVPFEYMNSTAQRVYETLCPKKENYKIYRKTAIPMEVLSLIALSVHENYFEYVEIWYDDKTPDPLAVGKIKKDSYSYDHYLIARWGDVLRPFEELKEKAISVYRRSAEVALRSKIADLNVKLQNIDSNVDAYFDVQIENYNVVGF